jgi:uncharacterized protein YjiS (DUF1127 family)
MSISLLERPAASQGAWQAVMERVAGDIAELRRQQKARRDRRHAMRLPDCLPRDIGLSRHDAGRMNGWDSRRSLVLPDIGWRRRP